MQDSVKVQALHMLDVVVAFAPWLVSMFVLYWLEYGQVWTTATPHRGKISVAILILGMGLSFLLSSRLFKRK
jgi:hypothetical protein